MKVTIVGAGNVGASCAEYILIKQIAEESKYDFIFDRSSTATMLYSVKNYDISDLVIKRINRQQKIQKRKLMLMVTLWCIFPD